MSSTNGRHERTHRLGFKGALAELRHVYEDNEAGHVVDAFDDARRRSWTFRLLTGALERFYPVRAFLYRAAYLLDPSIGERGLHAGCRRIFETLALDWEPVIAAGGEETLRSGPIIFYGNHPSLLTPFLAAAAIDREDLFFCSTNYVRRLIPSFRKYSYPLEVSLTRSWTEWKRGGLQRVLAYRLVSLLHSVPEADAARETNLEALRQAARDLRDGGSVMIIPSGGGKRDRTWFAGIGILARDLLDNPGGEDVLVVAIREENSSNKRIYASMMNGPIACLKRRYLYRRPIRFTFAEPLLLTDVAGDAGTVRDTVAALRTHYETRFEL